MLPQVKLKKKNCLFIFRGHSTWEPASSRVTYFILRAYTGMKKSGEVLEKNAGKWTGRVEISKEEIPGSKRSMYDYILTHPRLQRENVYALYSHQIGLCFLRPQLPTAGRQKAACALDKRLVLLPVKIRGEMSA